jgi:hypothetical protein
MLWVNEIWIIFLRSAVIGVNLTFVACDCDSWVSSPFQAGVVQAETSL